jgi:hypothetical protein
MYQLPHLSLAIRGSWKAEATFATKAPSAEIEVSLLWMLRLLRLRSRSVVFIEVEAPGKRMSLSRRGAMVGYVCGVGCQGWREVLRWLVLTCGKGRLRWWCFELLEVPGEPSSLSRPPSTSKHCHQRAVSWTATIHMECDNQTRICNQNDGYEVLCYIPRRSAMFCPMSAVPRICIYTASQERRPQ